MGPQVWGNIPIIFTPVKNYTSADYNTLFEKSNFPYGFERYQLIGNLTADLIAPGVDTIHMYGIDVDTATGFKYSSDTDFDTEPETINGKWFVEKVFSQRTHSGILKDGQYIHEIISYL